MKTPAAVLLAIVTIWLADAVAAQQGCQPSWLPTFGTQATELDNTVDALVVFDDGSGNGPALYAGGSFTTAGGHPANHVASWDGVRWSAVGNGPNGWVHSLTVFEDGSGGGPALYAGTAVGVSKWDGSSWSSVGSTFSGLGWFVPVGVFSLTAFDDGSGGGPTLFAGGNFYDPWRNIAKWDGSSWSGVAGGLVGTLHDTVYALKVFDSGGGAALYVGLGLSSSPAFGPYEWNGTDLSLVGGGVGGGTSPAGVLALEVFDDGSGGGSALYVAGEFTTAGGAPANRIAKWDGTSWSALGDGVDDHVDALAVFDDGTGPALYAAGDFTSAGGLPASRVAKWDGVSWSALGSGMNKTSFSLYNKFAVAAFDDGGGGGPALYAGGDFTTSTSGDSYITKWGCPPPPAFTTFCMAKTELVCGPAHISATGIPSATATSGFIIKAQPVRGCRAGLLLYSNQPAVPGAAFGGPGNGVLCLFAMGLKRAGPIQTGSMPQLCEATFAIDMNRFNTNNWSAGGCNPPPGQNNPAGFLGNMGTTVNAQTWGRDSIATGQVLSDGIRWTVGP